MSTPTLATNDEYLPLSAESAKPAIEMGSLLYRFEHECEQFAVFETAEETFLGRYTTDDSNVTHYRISPRVELARTVVIWMEAGFTLAAFDSAAAKRLFAEFNRRHRRPSE
jgi:hypothetical protein